MAAPFPIPPDSNAEQPLGSPRPRVSNQAVAAAVIGIMVVMAVVGLIFALQTEAVRRAHDVNLGKPQLVTVPPLIKIASNLWVVGLVALLLSIGWQRVRQAPGDATAAPNRFLWAVGVVVVLVGVSVAVSLLSGPLRKQSSQWPAAPEPSVAPVPPARNR